MAASRFVEALNEQIAYEFGASQQYIAIAVWYDGQTLPRLAQTFYAQAVEERNHAMMMIQYLMDRDVDVHVPGVAAPKTEFDDCVAPVALALTSSQSRMNSPRSVFQWAASGESSPSEYPSGCGCAYAKKAAPSWRTSPGHQPTSTCCASPALRVMKSSPGGSAGRPE